VSTLAELGIVVRLGGPDDQRLPCPRCAKRARDEALSVNVDAGLFHCFRCGWAGRADRVETHVARRVARLDDPAIAERKRERLRRIWKATVALDDPAAAPVRRYLTLRGLADILSDPPHMLRAHAGLSYFDGARDLGIYPAMVALVADAQGQGVTLHATYLRTDGTKAPVPSPKKVLGVAVRGSTKGGAIRLYPPNGTLGVTEGIETALSLRLMQHVPVWCAYCADNLARIRLPRGLTELYIGVDIDESGKGEQVSRALAARVARWRHGPKVYLVRPDGAAPCDLNDEWRRRAG
jgi:putative DNA primase/helicase